MNNTIPQLPDSKIKQLITERKNRCELLMLSRESGVRAGELAAIVRDELPISFDTRFMLSAVWE